MNHRLILRIALVALPAMYAAACSNNKTKRATDSTTAVNAPLVAEPSGDNATPSAPPPTIAIRTTNGAMDLGIRRDSIYMGLSDSILAKTRADMAKDADTSGFGGAIAGFVKRKVSSALGTKLMYAASDLDSVRYTGSAIRFYYRNPHKMKFEDVTIDNNRKALESFNPDDAQRFVAAANAAIAASGGKHP